MSGNAAVDPAEVPVFTGNLEWLDTKVKALSTGGAKIATAAGDVHTSFGGLRAFYKAPEAEQLFAVTKPVSDTGLSLSSDLCVIVGALGTYARDARPLKEKLENLRGEASAFRTKIDGDDKWREDGDLIEENLDRRNEIAEVWAAFQEIERTCHNKIVALVCGTPLKVNDGSNKEGMYGYDAEALKQSKSLPWGDAVEESTPAWQVWEHAWDFGKGVIVDGVWGTIKGLGTLVGFSGWDAAGQAWVGLGKLATGLVITSIPGANVAFWMADDKDMPAWLRDSRTAMKETGKALVAWDQWGENPARAAGAVTFNVVTTVFTGGTGGAAAGAGKAGAAAKALSFAGKAGRAIDPTTYIFKGAGAGLSKIGDVMAGLKGMGKIEIPALPEGAITLPEGSFKMPDGTLHLPEGAAIPEGAFEVPKGTVQLPEGAAIPKGAVDLGDGMVKMPDGTPPPAGSMPVPEGAIKVPEGTTALPEGTAKVTDLDGNTVYVDGKGNLLKEDGTLQQHHSAATKEPGGQGADPANPTAGADNPRVPNPTREPALVGAGAAHVGDNAGGPIRLGDSLDNNLGDIGRSGDDLPGGNPANNLPGGAANNMPGGGIGNNMPTNSLDGTTGTGSADSLPGGRTDTPGTAPSAADSTTDTLPRHPETPGMDDLGRTGDAGRGSDDLPGEGTQSGDRSGHDDGSGHADDSADSNPANDQPDAGGANGKPDDGNPYAGQEPDYSRPALLPADGPLTLRDVRNTRDHVERWQRGEELHRQMWGGGPERPYPVPTNSDPRYPVTAPGGRKVDVPVDLPDGRTIAVEVKTYGPYRTITMKDGTHQTIANEVPLSKGIKEQIHKDIALRRLDPGYDPRWSFTHAGPSAELRAYLNEAKIIFLEYGPAPKRDQWDPPKKK